MAVPSLDAIVIKLLELSHADKIHAPQIKNLVTLLPAAAAEVRGRAADQARTGPCSCGLDEEVARLHTQLQAYIDNEPDNVEKQIKKKKKWVSKVNVKKTLSLEVARLTKTVTDQKKEINNYLATIQQQNAANQSLRRGLGAAQDPNSLGKNTRVLPIGPAATMGGFSSVDSVFYQPAEHAPTFATMGSGGNDAMDRTYFTHGHGAEQVPVLRTNNALAPFAPHLGGRRSQPVDEHRSPAFANNMSTGSVIRKSPGLRSSKSRDPRLNAQSLSRPLPPYVARQSRNTGYAPSTGAPSWSDIVRRVAAEEVVGSSTTSKKRSAAEEIEVDAPERARADSAHDSNGTAATRKPLCEGCRSSGAECNHKSSCVECDNQNSPCIYTLCADLDSCRNPSCNYLHDDQWDAKESPVWLIKGINTFSDDSLRETSELSKALKHFCAPGAGVRASEQVSVEGHHAAALAYRQAP